MTEKKLTLTVKQAARAAHCHHSHINRLLAAGKLPGEKGHGPRNGWLVTGLTREQVRERVGQLSPRAGYHKRANANGDRRKSRLGPVNEWTALPAEKRALLLAIAKRFSVPDLKTIVKL